MIILRIAMAAICGTTIMTAFSYVVSEIREKQFKEPQLLNKLVARADIVNFSPSKKDLTGWLLHYQVGLMFAISYDLLWRKTRLQPNVNSSLALGAVSGVLGIIVWNVVFKLHPNPPRTHLKEFNLQLFIAHLIFAYYAMKGYTLAGEDTPQKALAA